MKFEFSDDHDGAGTVCAPVFAKCKTGAAADSLDHATGGQLRRAMDASRFNGDAGEVLEILAPIGIKANRVLLVGVGKKSDDMQQDFERFGAAAMSKVITSGDKELTLFTGDVDAGWAAHAAYGAQLAGYRFDRYRTKMKEKQTPSISKVRIACDDFAKAKAAFGPLSAIGEGVYLARDLVSEPGNVINPESFAARVCKLEELGVEVDILDERAMAKLGMNALLSVGHGSKFGSKLGVMKWNGGKKGDAPVVLVGKGVTFDSGGISLKPGAGMWDMKGDMGGAAAVTGAMRALAGRKAKANVIGIVGLVENMPDANATRPGDIVTSADGQTIEVQNTDAEGRLVLVDALWYGIKHFEPARIINLATLTGAIIIALGHENAGVFSNDDSLASDLTEAGKKSGEPVWRLPMGSGYDKLLNSPNADMKNISGGRDAGSITAAQFLQRFVGKTPWAHIDIAGMAWKDKRSDPREPVWSTGFGVRLLNAFIAENHEN